MTWRAISVSPYLGGIGVSRLNDPNKLNLYNDHTFLLSGYGDLYSFGGRGVDSSTFPAQCKYFFVEHIVWFQ